MNKSKSALRLISFIPLSFKHVLADPLSEAFVGWSRRRRQRRNEAQIRQQDEQQRRQQAAEKAHQELLRQAQEDFSRPLEMGLSGKWLSMDVYRRALQSAVHKVYGLNLPLGEIAVSQDDGTFYTNLPRMLSQRLGVSAYEIEFKLLQMVLAQHLVKEDHQGNVAGMPLAQKEMSDQDKDDAGLLDPAVTSARVWAEKLGLPMLKGSPKRVYRAELARRQMLTNLLAHGWIADDRKYKMVLSLARRRKLADWWLDITNKAFLDRLMGDDANARRILGDNENTTRPGRYTRD